MDRQFNVTRTFFRELAIIKYSGQVDLALASLEAVVSMHNEFINNHLQRKLACEGHLFQEML